MSLRLRAMFTIAHRGQHDAPMGAPPVELKRWAVLGCYNVIGLMQSMVWVSYSASATEVRLLYGPEVMSVATVNLLREPAAAPMPGRPTTVTSLRPTRCPPPTRPAGRPSLVNWGPITYIAGIGPVMWMLSRGGGCVHQCMLAAGWLTAFGAVLRCVPDVLPRSAALAPPVCHPPRGAETGPVPSVTGPLPPCTCSLDGMAGADRVGPPRTIPERALRPRGRRLVLCGRRGLVRPSRADDGYRRRLRSLRARAGPRIPGGHVHPGHSRLSVHAVCRGCGRRGWGGSLDRATAASSGAAQRVRQTQRRPVRGKGAAFLLLATPAGARTLTCSRPLTVG